jgi:uncharacterized membrane protein
MEIFEKTFEIGVPVRTAYNQFTQFEDFPEFMEDVLDVEQVDDTHLHWRVTHAGQEMECDVEIREQVPDEVIAWESTSDPPDGGEVHFAAVHEDPDRSRISFYTEYELEVDAEHEDEAVSAVSQGIEKAMEDFKRFIEKRGVETGGWRGEVHDGVRTGPAGVGTPDEPLPGGEPVTGVG